MASTYEPIATQTMEASSSSVTFTSIPSTYTDLLLVFSGSATSFNNHYVRMGNGSLDTGSNYSSTILYGDGSGAGSERASNDTNGVYVGTGDTSAMNGLMHIMNYSNSTTYKTSVTRINAVGRWVGASVGLWRSFSAINTIQYRVGAGTINTGSTFTLYGIKAA